MSVIADPRVVGRDAELRAADRFETHEIPSEVSGISPEGFYFIAVHYECVHLILLGTTSRATKQDAKHTRINFSKCAGGASSGHNTKANQISTTT